MIETTEPIQDPVLPESPVPYIQAQPPESHPPEPERPAQDETALSAEIAQLWQIHNDFKLSLRQQSQNLHSLRAELGKKLAEVKGLLSRPGRGGEWSGWLRERRIPRATADRLVLKYERSLHPDSNCINESISEPTDDEIRSLLDKIAPKLRKVLRTPASAYRFINLVAFSFEGLDRRVTEEGFLIVNPSQETAAVEPEPAKSPVECQSSMPDTLAETSAEPLEPAAVQ